MSNKSKEVVIVSAIRTPIGAYKGSLKNIKSHDCILILTDHDNINYKLIEQNSKLIFDTRNRIKTKKNLIKL